MDLRRFALDNSDSMHPTTPLSGKDFENKDVSKVSPITSLALDFSSANLLNTADRGLKSRSSSLQISPAGYFGRAKTDLCRSSSFHKRLEGCDDIDTSQDSGVFLSPKNSNRTKKFARRPSRLFALGGSSKTDDSEAADEIEQDENFENLFVGRDATSNAAFMDLFVRPLKTSACLESDAAGKKNLGLGSSRRILTEESQENTYKNCGDGFKRPIPPRDVPSPLQSKRAKSVSYTEYKAKTFCNRQNALFTSGYISDEEEATNSESEDVLFELPTEAIIPLISDPVQTLKNLAGRSHSESEVSIMRAVERSDSDPMLIGDCSKRFLLPLVAKGKHDDLKEISGLTLAKLMSGEYAKSVSSFKIVDCRYPYEYNGGHIIGAMNLCTKKQISEYFIGSKEPKSCDSFEEERNIIIFHCEFSSQRGPDMCRYLRQADRTHNMSSFPCLLYPEMYVLFGGYKLFFEDHLEHCQPESYMPMADPQYVEECRMWKTKSKTDVVSSKKGSFLSRLPRNSSLKFNL